MSIEENLIQLGAQTALPQSPEEAVLEAFDNPHSSVDYHIRFTCPEFTSLCPKTGQPDFAQIIIDYIPRKSIVESKSLKLFLHSFRNHGAFHEDCTISIAKRIIEAIEPTWLRIGGFWYPRGGIPIDIFFQTGEKPSYIWVPDMPEMPYRGRG